MCFFLNLGKPLFYLNFMIIHFSKLIAQEIQPSIQPPTQCYIHPLMVYKQHKLLYTSPHPDITSIQTLIPCATI